VDADTVWFWHVGRVFKESTEVTNCERCLFSIVTLQWQVDSLQHVVHALLYCASHQEVMNSCRPRTERCISQYQPSNYMY